MIRKIYSLYGGKGVDLVAGIYLSGGLANRR